MFGTKDESAELKKLITGLGKLGTKELMGIAALLGVEVWTEPRPIEVAHDDASETAAAIIPFPSHADSGSTSISDAAAVANTQNAAGNNPFIDANRSQPKPGEDILWEMCEQYLKLPRANRRNLMKMIKTAGGK